MAENTLGKTLKITSFGESHGAYIGVIIDGFPSNFLIDIEDLQNALNRRRPGQSHLTTQRKEDDKFQIISGVFEGRTTGATITILIPNNDAKPTDYEPLKDVYRPSHADFTYQSKYGLRDYRGGGRSSARITAGWVAAGALAEQFLKSVSGIEIVSWVDSVYSVQAEVNEKIITREEIETSVVRCPDDAAAARMEVEIEMAKTEGDSLGGTIRALIRNCPVGLGEPVFGKINAKLGHALLSINAVKGVEFGDGFDFAKFKGSEMNDALAMDGNKITALTNHSGGMQGGISNGADIRFRVAFKPTATISKEQQTVTSDGTETTLSAAGRHDPCVLPRAVPIVDAVTALVLMDLWLENRIAQI